MPDPDRRDRRGSQPLCKVRRNVFPATAASRSALVSLPQSCRKQRRHVRVARASKDYLKASRRSETPRSLPHTFPLLHKQGRDSGALEMNSDRARESSCTARLLYRFVLTGNRSSQGVNSPQKKAAPTPPFVLPRQLLRQNARRQQGTNCTTGAPEHTRA